MILLFILHVDHVNLSTIKKSLFDRRPLQRGFVKNAIKII